MPPRARAVSGTGIEALLVAATLADAAYRSVFTHGPDLLARARRETDAATMTAARQVGRFGWVNLLGPLTAGRQLDTDGLLELVGSTDPATLHAVALGSRRAQLTSLLPPGTVEAVTGGDAAARRAMRSAIGSDATVVHTTPWLLSASSTDVATTVAATLAQLIPLAGDAPDAGPSRRRLKQSGLAGVLAEVLPGIRQAPAQLGDVVLATSRLVHPIVVVVDEPGRTVVVHPEYGDDGPDDAAARLQVLGRAVGDTTRIRLLQELASGPLTLPELCAALTAPRTTLLHHLALLRAGGLVELDVPASGPNVYRASERGLDDFGRILRAFAGVEKSRQ